MKKLVVDGFDLAGRDQLLAVDLSWPGPHHHVIQVQRDAEGALYLVEITLPEAEEILLRQRLAEGKAQFHLLEARAHAEAELDRLALEAGEAESDPVVERRLVSFRVPVEIKSRLQHLAKQLGSTPPEVVTDLLYDLADELVDGHPLPAVPQWVRSLAAPAPTCKMRVPVGLLTLVHQVAVRVDISIDALVSLAIVRELDRRHPRLERIG